MFSPEITCTFDCYPPLFFELGLGPFVIAVVMALLTRRWRYVPLAALIGVAIIFGLELAWRALVIGERPFAYAGYLAADPGAAAPFYVYLFIHQTVLTALVFALKRTLLWIASGEAPLPLRAGIFVALVATIGAGVFAFVFMFVPDILPRRLAERAHQFRNEVPLRCELGDASTVAGLPPFRGYQELPPTRPIIGMPEAFAALPAVYTTWMGFDHMLTRVEAIHVPDLKRFEPLTAVAVEVAVSETGQVLAVRPTAGPKDLYPQAIEIASRWRFSPFWRDGKAVPARLVRMSVPIGGSELWGAHSDAPPFSDWDSVAIKIEWDQFDFDYTLEIRGDGSVTYEGRGDWLALKDRHCAVIPRESVRALIEDVKRADFFSLLDNYESETAVFVSFALDDNVKQVRVRRSMPQEAKRQTPEKLFRLVDAVVQAAHVERWTKGNALTVPTLQAERWKFTPGDDHQLRVLSDVARVGDVEAVRGLLGLKVPVMTTAGPIPWPGPPRTMHTALEVAAVRGAFDIVRVLLDSGIPWSADALGGAYVGAIAQGNQQLADELLRRGANPLAIGSHEEMNVLMAAASSGLPDAVAAALKRKLDVNAGPVAPLLWAAGVDYPRTIDSTRADRGRVIDMLMAAGASIESESGNGSPLVANWMGLPDVTAALIKHGANLNARDHNDQTALMTNKSVRSVQLLLAAGADPYLRDEAGRNALDVAHADEFAQDIVPVLERWMAAHPPKP